MGLTYRIQLRDDARFADGSPITAQDVAFSLTRALSPQTAADAGAALAGPSYLADIVGADEVIRGEASELAGLRVVDDRTVEIDLKAPRATFLMKLASAPAAIVDPDDVARGGEWWRDPNASGPYVVDVWEPEVELQLYANEQLCGWYAGPAAGHLPAWTERVQPRSTSTRPTRSTSPACRFKRSIASPTKRARSCRSSTYRRSCPRPTSLSAPTLPRWTIRRSDGPCNWRFPAGRSPRSSSVAARSRRTG